MLSSTKNNFRINLKSYCSLNFNKKRGSRQGSYLSSTILTPRNNRTMAEQNACELSSMMND